ncbi:hypothetical protein niasHT_008970 [Heterodera trifolii]|uniref:Uncharacterized protein n=1 Tax=Heterodera trifolii TaxID=157864 RepID=A0ABD2M136_9BILA
MNARLLELIQARKTNFSRAHAMLTQAECKRKHGRRHRLGTGDGMEFSIPNSSKQVIQMFGTSASFSGVPGGAETSTTRGDIVLMESEMTGDESSFGGHGFGDEEKEITELTKMPMSSETSFVPIKKFRYESPAGRGTPISRGSSRPPSSRPSTSEIAELQLKFLQCDLERIELQKQLCEEAKKFMEEGRSSFHSARFLCCGRNAKCCWPN